MGREKFMDDCETALIMFAMCKIYKSINGYCETVGTYMRYFRMLCTVTVEL